MKRNLSVRIRQWTHECQADLLVEKVIADNKGRPPAFLLMTALRVKGQGNEISL